MCIGMRAYLSKHLFLGRVCRIATQQLCAYITIKRQPFDPDIANKQKGVAMCFKL